MYHSVEKQHEHRISINLCCYWLFVFSFAHLWITSTQTSYIHTRNRKRWLDNEQKTKNSIDLSIFIQTHTHTRRKREKDELKKRKKKKKTEENKQTNTKKRELCLDWHIIWVFLSLFLMIICCTLDHVSKGFLHSIFLSPLSRRLNKQKNHLRVHFIHHWTYSIVFLLVRLIRSSNIRYQWILEKNEFRPIECPLFIHQDWDRREVNKLKVTL